MKIATEKILSKEKIVEVIEKAKHEGKKIVTTNGVFDLIHYGHVWILEEAKSLGDILIVLVNSDESVRRLRGKARPIIGERERAKTIAALACVDYVCIFKEDTPTEMLEVIRPHIHVKGADRKIEEIVERKVVEQNGGKLVLLPLIEGISTTNVIERILKVYG